MLILQALLAFLPLITAQKPDLEFRSGFKSVSCYNETALKIEYKGDSVVIISCKPPQPYCHPSWNICVSDPPQKTFICEDDGIFPHISDCNGAYFCLNDQLVDNPCPLNTQFDYEKKLCRKFSWHETCRRSDCRGKNGVYVGHPLNDRLYVFCIDGFPDSMHLCPPGKNFVPGHSAPCEFVCMGIGDFPDSENKELYYSCHWDGTRIVRKTIYCPSGMYFQYSPGVSRCLPTVSNATQSTVSNASSLE